LNYENYLFCGAGTFVPKYVDEGGLLFGGAFLLVNWRAELLGHICGDLFALFTVDGVADLLVLRLVLCLVDGLALLVDDVGALLLEDGF
jgi:hypothetical protein